MNKYMPSVRKRRRTLLIVEGDHEKNILFKALFQAFPEMGINYEDVWIYGTNIYILYNDIVKEYGADWANTGDDIDLPLVISKKKTPDLIIGKGEASAIALAKVRGGAVASNNLRDVKAYVEEYGLELITTGDILKEALTRGLITEAPVCGSCMIYSGILTCIIVGYTIRKIVYIKEAME